MCSRSPEHALPREANLHREASRLSRGGFETISRAQFVEELQDRYVNASVHFIPVHEHTYYREKYGWRPDDFPVAHREFTRMLSLPIYPLMTDDDVDDVVAAVRAIVTKNRRRT